jgi:phage shock protein C
MAVDTRNTGRVGRARHGRLRRSSWDKMIFGVCGGLAEYLDVDPVIVRLLFVLVALAGGAALPVYVILAVLVPRAGALTGPLDGILPER